MKEEQACLAGHLTTLEQKKISRFLESHGPHFEFVSSSFNYSMPKEGSSGVKGERNSM